MVRHETLKRVCQAPLRKGTVRGGIALTDKKEKCLTRRQTFLILSARKGRHPDDWEPALFACALRRFLRLQKITGKKLQHLSAGAGALVRVVQIDLFAAVWAADGRELLSVALPSLGEKPPKGIEQNGAGLKGAEDGAADDLGELPLRAAGNRRGKHRMDAVGIVQERPEEVETADGADKELRSRIVDKLVDPTLDSLKEPLI